MTSVWKLLYKLGFFSLLDEDGDLIAFSTGEELLEALGFVDNGLFRVFVKPSKWTYGILTRISVFLKIWRRNLVM